jgi:hypothetical protein
VQDPVTRLGLSLFNSKGNLPIDYHSNVDFTGSHADNLPDRCLSVDKLHPAVDSQLLPLVAYYGYDGVYIQIAMVSNNSSYMNHVLI